MTALRSQIPAERRRIHIPAHGQGVLHPFQPGESGNPSGKGALFHQAQRIARQASPEAAQRLVELMRSRDERVALLACERVLERAWGKVKEVAEDEIRDPTEDCLRVQARAEIIGMLERLARSEPLVVDGEPEA